MEENNSETKDLTTISITKNTHKKLSELGKKSETFDQILRRMLDKVEVFAQ